MILPKIKKKQVFTSVDLKHIDLNRPGIDTDFQLVKHFKYQKTPLKLTVLHSQQMKSRSKISQKKSKTQPQTERVSFFARGDRSCRVPLNLYEPEPIPVTQKTLYIPKKKMASKQVGQLLSLRRQESELRRLNVQIQESQEFDWAKKCIEEQLLEEYVTNFHRLKSPEIQENHQKQGNELSQFELFDTRLMSKKNELLEQFQGLQLDTNSLNKSVINKVQRAMVMLLSQMDEISELHPQMIRQNQINQQQNQRYSQVYNDIIKK